MTSDSQWPEQQLGDLAAYLIVAAIITGGDPKQFSALPPERYGRWQPIVLDLFDAHRQGGRVAVFRRYLQLVYSRPDFALLIASLGTQSPEHQWRPEELPNRTNPSPSSLDAPPTPPAAVPPPAPPRRKVPADWSAWDLLSGYYDRPPLKRHAVREEQVYAALRELGEATVMELARHTGQDRANVHRRVQKLLGAGQIERHVTPNAIVYRLRAASAG